MPVATLNVLDKTKMVTMSTTVAQLVERTLEATPSPLPASKHALLTCEWDCHVCCWQDTRRRE